MVPGDVSKGSWGIPAKIFFKLSGDLIIAQDMTDISYFWFIDSFTSEHKDKDDICFFFSCYTARVDGYTAWGHNILECVTVLNKMLIRFKSDCDRTLCRMYTGLNVNIFFLPDSRDAIASKNYSYYNDFNFLPYILFLIFCKRWMDFYNMKVLDYYFPCSDSTVQ